ncbi:MAG TPA: phosphate ABC transporter permease PstA [Phycisphaerae bacterium]|nr:phosphate ABC transporter permease PstA [Phycisphaerae bacterium]
MTVAMGEIQGGSAPKDSFRRRRNLSNSSAWAANFLAKGFCYGAALVTITALFLIFGYILYRGFDCFVQMHPLHINWGFFTQSTGYPDPEKPFGGIGLRNCIAGSLTLILMASVLGVPVGMLCGIYLAEYARENWFNHAIRLMVDVLAGVPSIIVGVLGYQLVVVPMRTSSAWAGAVALGFIMCPIVARTTEEMLKLVPKALREASIGLGGSKAQTLVRIVLPAASSGIITGVMLGVARVAGETAPLLFTAGMSDQPVYSFDWRFPFMHADLNHSFPSLTVIVFQYATSPVKEWMQLAWGGMLVLVTIVLVLNIMVRVASSRKRM